MPVLTQKPCKKAYLPWVEQIAEVFEEVIAIDGKALRRADERGGDQGMIYLVSAWATESRLVLGQQQVEEKSNKITAVLKLLELLHLNGCLVTLNAIGKEKWQQTTVATDSKSLWARNSWESIVPPL